MSNPNAERKVLFRELARNIVQKDRERRFNKQNVNTAAEIAANLERAFQLGRKSVNGADPINQLRTPEFVRLPPRLRNALWSLCWLISKRHEKTGKPDATLCETSIDPDPLLTNARNMESLAKRGLVTLDRGRLALTAHGFSVMREFEKAGGVGPDDYVTL
jgi:hypothetical protein